MAWCVPPERFGVYRRLSTPDIKEWNLYKTILVQYRCPLIPLTGFAIYKINITGTVHIILNVLLSFNTQYALRSKLNNWINIVRVKKSTLWSEKFKMLNEAEHYRSNMHPTIKRSGNNNRSVIKLWLSSVHWLHSQTAERFSGCFHHTTCTSIEYQLPFFLIVTLQQCNSFHLHYLCTIHNHILFFIKLIETLVLFIIIELVVSRTNYVQDDRFMYISRYVIQQELNIVESKRILTQFTIVINW